MGAILRVGLTGNIGAGKSTVGAMLEDAGCLLIDADLLAHDLLAPGTEANEQVVALFGDGVRATDGGIDRKALARIVFADDSDRRRLESIIHPRIPLLEDDRIAAWGVECGIAVTEAALLVETGGAARYQRLVVVTAPVETRRMRLLERGLTDKDIRRRMAAQLPEAEKAAVADYTIDNGNSLEATAVRVLGVLAALRQDLDDLAAGISLSRR